ncbi:MAG: hypothetical protein ACI9U2_000487 [Bradymonadia bacterium]|jgi:hypothetical protein
MTTTTAERPSVGYALLRRGWPLLSGLVLCSFFAIAETQNWTPFSDRPYTPSLLEWLATRFSAPVMHFISDPVAAWPFVILAFVVTRHLYRPRWWNAPLTTGGMMVWCIWGSGLLGYTAG